MTSSPTAPSIPIAVTSDGWIHYNGPQTQTALATPGTTNVTVKGGRNASGACVYSGKTTLPRGDYSSQQVETAANPALCEMQLAESPPEESTSTARPAFAHAAASDDTSPVNEYGYQKIAEIDPLGITIVSLQTAIAWNYTGNPAVNQTDGDVTYAIGDVDPYEFQYDGWSTEGGESNPPPVYYDVEQPSGNTDYASVSDNETFLNTDFEDLVVATTGPAGLAACGFNDNTATFDGKCSVGSTT